MVSEIYAGFKTYARLADFVLVLLKQNYFDLAFHSPHPISCNSFRNLLPSSIMSLDFFSSFQAPAILKFRNAHLLQNSLKS